MTKAVTKLQEQELRAFLHERLEEHYRYSELARKAIEVFEWLADEDFSFVFGLIGEEAEPPEVTGSWASG